MENTTLLWWIDAIRIKSGNWYRYHVAGHMTDASHPDWPGNGVTFSWSVPNLDAGGGRFVFALKEIAS